MAPGEWFDDLPVLGKMRPAQAADTLRALGHEGVAAATLVAGEGDTAEESADKKFFGGGSSREKLYLNTAHVYGHLGPGAAGETALSIRSASAIDPDPTLKNARIKITLGHLRVARYPGSGIHRILFDFYAQNEVLGAVEDLHFAMTFRGKEGQAAAVIGYPIFVGLNVGVEGVAFKCYTINVQNEQDEGFLQFLDSDVFKAGLQLASTLQPAIAPLSGLAVGLTRTIASRHKNIPVQDFFLGLDFSTMPFHARLAEGSYIVVQIPESSQATWNWNDWVYVPNRAQILDRATQGQIVPYNYIVFNVSRYQGQ